MTTTPAHDNAPDTIWHLIDRRGKIEGSPDAHVKPCAESIDAYQSYTRTDTIPTWQTSIDWGIIAQGQTGWAIEYSELGVEVYRVFGPNCDLGYPHRERAFPAAPTQGAAT